MFPLSKIRKTDQTMKTISKTEENYLKAIYKICEETGEMATNNAISSAMNTTAASVTDMIKRLSKNQLIHYQKHKGARLTDTGNTLATNLVRKHRLWETFLVEKLNFTWDEVHDIAEELEHIKSPELIDRLDAFLGNPKFDPHGDPIPDIHGNIVFRKQIPLSELTVRKEAVIVGVQDHSPTFLQYLDKLGLVLGGKIKVIERFEYDGSTQILLNDQQEQILTNKVCNNLFVKLI